MSTARKILIADRDKAHIESLTRYLREEGFIIDSANTAAEMLTLLGTNDYTLVLSDIDLPDSTGMALLSKISKLQNTTKNLIFMGNNRKTDLMEFYRATGRPAFAKPVQSTVLKRLIK
ncbi:MAG: response regulator [Deltaproteobacteria bacterium]|nr:response regulator [Deltaproteobacteria bacterium]